MRGWQMNEPEPMTRGQKTFLTVANAIVWTVAAVLAGWLFVAPLLGPAMDGEAVRQDMTYVSDWVRLMDGQSEFLTAANGWRTE